MKKCLLLFLVLILFSGLVFISCTSPETTTQTTTKTQATTTPTAGGPQYGGTLKILTRIPFSNLGYPPQGMGDQIYAAPAVENLVTLDSENKGEILPQLATDWQYSSDLKSLTFTLRQGVKFHDGTPFNAQAAKFCLDMIKESGLGFLNSVESVVIVDDYTIRMNLSVYEPSLLLDLAMSRNSMMVSPTAINSMSEEEANTHPVGTGPFKFASFQRDVSLKYERFDDYWQDGKPYLDALEIYFYADAVTALVAFQAGEGQALRSPSPKDATDLEATGQFIIYRTPAAVFGLAFDSGNPDSPFADIKVRQAVFYATDIEAINEVCGYGLTATNQFAFPNNWYYNPEVVGYPYNVQKAKEVLAESDYPEGFSTSIFYENVGAIGTMATAMQSYLREINIEAELVPQERATFIQTRTGGWNNGMVWFNLNISAASDPGSRMRSAISSSSSEFASIYVPADYDAKLSEAIVEPDFEKRKILFQELEKMIIDDYCLAIPCYALATQYATTLQVHGFDACNYGQSIWHPEDVWLSE